MKKDYKKDDQVIIISGSTTYAGTGIDGHIYKVIEHNKLKTGVWIKRPAHQERVFMFYSEVTSV